MKVENGMVRLGDVVEHLDRYGKLPVQEWRRRKAFAERNSGFHVEALYNNGRNVYIDMAYKPADAGLGQEWLWLPFLALCSCKDIAKNMPPLMYLERHNQWNQARLCYGFVNKVALAHRHWCRFVIPPLFIQYIAVDGYFVRDQLLVFQPIPNKKCPRV